MQVRDFVVLSYGALGEIKGKNSLQRGVYYLSVTTGANLGFGPHYYGPYSGKVANANSELSSLNYIKEEIILDSAAQLGYRVAQHNYSLNEDGQKLFHRKMKLFPKEWNAIAKFSKIIKAEGNINYTELLLVTKVFFKQKREKALINAEIIKKTVGALGITIYDSELSKAVKFLEKLNLISVEC